MIFYGKRFGIWYYELVLYVRLTRNRLMYLYQSLEELLRKLYTKYPNPTHITTGRNIHATHPIAAYITMVAQPLLLFFIPTISPPLNGSYYHYGYYYITYYLIFHNYYCNSSKRSNCSKNLPSLSCSS